MRSIMADLPAPRRGKFYSTAELKEIWTRSDSEDEFIESRIDPEWDDQDENQAQAEVLDELQAPMSPAESVIDSEGESDFPTFDFNWVQTDFKPTIFPFDLDSGCTVPHLGAESSALECFEIFLTQDIVNFIVGETNNFYKYVCEHTNVKENSRLVSWKDTNIEELWRFFGLTMLMPRSKKLQISEYWSKDSLLKTPIFGEMMARDRYLIILRLLHFCDNNSPKNNDTLFKLRKIVDHFRNSFKSSFKPGKELCIDESLLLFKGRLFFKQYIPAKRHRFGVKLFVLCDSKTGYILDFVVYTGKTTEINQSNRFGVTGDVVLTLLQPYLDAGHCLYVDNWYTSPDLFLWLYSRSTNACGTVKKNRKNMPEMAEKLKKGELTFRSTSDKLLAVKYCDKREVYMLTTAYDNSTAPTGKVDRSTGRQIMKPECIVRYNKFMGAVDKTDMLLHSVECIRRTTKWYKKLFFHFLDLALLNSHVLYKAITKKSIPLAKFQTDLIREILAKYPSPTGYE